MGDLLALSPSAFPAACLIPGDNDIVLELASVQAAKPCQGGEVAEPGGVLGEINWLLFQDKLQKIEEGFWKSQGTTSCFRTSASLFLVKLRDFWVWTMKSQLSNINRDVYGGSLLPSF